MIRRSRAASCFVVGTSATTAMPPSRTSTSLSGLPWRPDLRLRRPFSVLPIRWLTYNPANPADFRVQLDNLGLQDLQAQGRLPQPGAALHPAVRDWIVSLQEVGVDPLRLVGRAISPAICVAETQTCMQYFDKQVFTFPATATRAAYVQRRPLGELLSHPQLVTATSTQSSWPPRTMLLGVAGLLGLAGFGLFLRGRQSGLSPVGTI